MGYYFDIKGNLSAGKTYNCGKSRSAEETAAEEKVHVSGENSGVKLYIKN